MTTATDTRLEYLRAQIRAESISYGELAELQGLAAHIHPSDVELLEWAGVPEYPTTPTRYATVNRYALNDFLTAYLSDLGWCANTEDDIEALNECVHTCADAVELLLGKGTDETRLA